MDPNQNPTNSNQPNNDVVRPSLPGETVTPANSQPVFSSSEQSPVAPQPEQPVASAQPVAPQPVATEQPNYADPVATPAPLPAAAPTPSDVADENPDKEYVVALIMSYFVGGLGVDRFYLGKVGTGILKLVTFGGFGIWQLVDLLLIAFGKLTAKDDPRMLHGFAKNYHWVKITTIILLVFNVVVVGGITLFIVLAAFTGMKESRRSLQYNTSVQNQNSSTQIQNN